MRYERGVDMSIETDYYTLDGVTYSYQKLISDDNTSTTSQTALLSGITSLAATSAGNLAATGSSGEVLNSAEGFVSASQQVTKTANDNQQ
jgi:hypothetical protein